MEMYRIGGKQGMNYPENHCAILNAFHKGAWSYPLHLLSHPPFK